MWKIWFDSISLRLNLHSSNLATPFYSYRNQIRHMFFIFTTFHVFLIISWFHWFWILWLFMYFCWVVAMKMHSTLCVVEDLIGCLDHMKLLFLNILFWYMVFSKKCICLYFEIWMNEERGLVCCLLFTVRWNIPFSVVTMASTYSINYYV